MKSRTGYPWLQAAEYSSSLKVLGVNLLVRDVKQALNFQQDVLCAKASCSDPDFAALRDLGSDTLPKTEYALPGRSKRGGFFRSAVQTGQHF